MMLLSLDAFDQLLHVRAAGTLRWEEDWPSMLVGCNWLPAPNLLRCRPWRQQNYLRTSGLSGWPGERLP